MDNPSPKYIETNVTAYPYTIRYGKTLSKPNGEPKADYFELTRIRKSSSGLSELTEQQLADVLWFSAKVIEAGYQSNGYIITHRPSPSAGARHPIDILVMTPHLSYEFNFYNSFEHSLHTLELDTSVLDNLLKHVNQNLEIGKATLLWFLGHPERTAAKYENPESLIWRDAGALLQSVQMACAALGLASCPIGTLGLPYINQLFNSRPVISAGGIIIGNNLVF